MLKTIEAHIDAMLTKYSQGEFFEILKQAKIQYMSLTGKLDEDQSEFESRMYCFNDWYLFQYTDNEGNKFVESYIKENKLESSLALALLKCNHSLFEYKKKNRKGQIVLNDLLHRQTITLSPEQDVVSLAEGDLFMGRTLDYQGESLLLKGVVLLPNSIKSTFIKECKKIKAQNSYKKEREFLLHVESLVTRSMNYLHIQPEKIFVFN